MIPTTPTVLFGDSWNGSDNAEWSMDYPSQDNIASSILRLGNNQYTSIFIEVDGTTLSVGGGPQLFLVMILKDGNTVRTLKGTPSGSETMVLNIGGQQSVYQITMLACQQLALSSARYFLEHGTPDPTLDWVPGVPNR